MVSLTLIGLVNYVQGKRRVGRSNVDILICLCRGFRQATRGPDTGAFHHPLFQRDKPELCLEMVCERTRGSTGTKKRNVPAKKRRIDFLTKESLDAMNKESPTSQPPLKPHTAVSVSDDGNSLKSNVSAPFSPAQPLTVDKQLPLIPHATQSITDNNDLVQRAITQRNEEERMRVAKAMLYNAFLAATKQEK